MTGLLVPMVEQRNATMTLNSSVQKLPRSLDYRKKGVVTAVKNQVRRCPALRFYDNRSVGTRQQQKGFIRVDPLKQEVRSRSSNDPL